MNLHQTLPGQTVLLGAIHLLLGGSVRIENVGVGIGGTWGGRILGIGALQERGVKTHEIHAGPWGDLGQIIGAGSEIGWPLCRFTLCEKHGIENQQQNEAHD